MNKVTLKNYRCFRGEQTANLAPLTLLVGENSTGKTSFLAMIRALWSVSYRHLIPDFKAPPYDLGSFDQISHYRGGRGGRAETFEATFDATEGASSTGEGPHRYHFETTFSRRGTAPFPIKRRFQYMNAWVEYRVDEDTSTIAFGTDNGAWRWHVPAELRAALGADLPTVYVLLQYLRYTIENDRESLLTTVSGSRQPAKEDWHVLMRSVWTLDGSSPLTKRELFAGAPVRSKPSRTYNPARPTVDPEGDYIPMYLADVQFQDRARWERLKGAIERFGRAAGLFDELAVKSMGKKGSDPFELQVRVPGGKAKGPRRNMIDVGYGVSQVLPVIAEVLRQDVPTLFLLQQPEVHLHPSAQAALGTLLCEIVQRDHQLVVETHSDHLIDRVRMEVRDGKQLKPNDVSILFFERRHLDVHIHSIRIDNEGNVRDAPDTYRRFFMEETQRSLGL